MERPRDSFLADAGFSLDERRPRVRGDAPDEAEEILHHGAAADHAAQLEAVRGLALRREQVGAPRQIVTCRSSCRRRSKSSGLLK
jgi:hypothetical protein